MTAYLTRHPTTAYRWDVAQQLTAGRRRADELMARHPRWWVLYSAFWGTYTAFPCGPASAGTLITRPDPAQLDTALRECQQPQATAARHLVPNTSDEIRVPQPRTHAWWKEC